MRPVVKLYDLADALEIPEEWGAWLDRQTGQVITIDTAVVAVIEEEGETGELPADLELWDADQLPAARAIAAGDERYLALPGKWDFHEYRHMEEFIRGLPDLRTAEKLWYAIKGKGAFRHFKDTAHRLGLIDDWYLYRDQAVNKFFLRWAEANGVTVDTAPPGPATKPPA